MKPNEQARFDSLYQQQLTHQNFKGLAIAPSMFILGQYGALQLILIVAPIS